jgi:hypothetical protein
MPPVSLLNSPSCFCYLISFHLTCVLFVGDIFLAADPTFSVFDETVKDVPNKIYIPITSLESPINEGIPFKSWSDLILPREKASKALLPILVIACLRLNSSSGLVDKHIIQSVFAFALFFNRAKLVPFSIHSRMNRSEFTPKANGLPSWETYYGTP